VNVVNVVLAKPSILKIAHAHAYLPALHLKCKMQVLAHVPVIILVLHLIFSKMTVLVLLQSWFLKDVLLLAHLLWSKTVFLVHANVPIAVQLEWSKIHKTAPALVSTHAQLHLNNLRIALAVPFMLLLYQEKRFQYLS